MSFFKLSEGFEILKSNSMASKLLSLLKIWYFFFNWNNFGSFSYIIFWLKLLLQISEGEYVQLSPIYFKIKSLLSISGILILI